MSQNPGERRSLNMNSCRAELSVRQKLKYDGRSGTDWWLSKGF
jgi:hypothetical protein